jgi:hypothetical protein
MTTHTRLSAALGQAPYQPEFTISSAPPTRFISWKVRLGPASRPAVTSPYAPISRAMPIHPATSTTSSVTRPV